MSFLLGDYFIPLNTDIVFWNTMGMLLYMSLLFTPKKESLELVTLCKSACECTELKLLDILWHYFMMWSTSP